MIRLIKYLLSGIKKDDPETGAYIVNLIHPILIFIAAIAFAIYTLKEFIFHVMSSLGIN